MILAIQQRLDGDPSEILERIYQAYRKPTNADPEAQESVWMVNITFTGQIVPDIRKKFKKLDGGIGNESLSAGGHSF